MLPKLLKNIALNSLLVIGSVLIGFILVELTFRPHNLKFENLILKEDDDLVNKFYDKLFKYDPTLGWLPLSNVSVSKWGSQVKTLDDGIRSNGAPTVLNDHAPILALGDSFTFGDQVSDDKTWPSYLEQLTHRKVYNAGVSSYGIDQVVLRLEKENLIKKYNPKIIILSIIYDDILRCMQTVRHGDSKPYFTLKNDELVLQKQPASETVRLDWFRNIFGYSYICHKLMSDRFPDYWFRGTSREFRTIPGDSLKITELLFDRFMRSTQSKDVIFLIQERARWGDLESLIDYIRKTYPKVHVVYLTPTLIHLENTNPQEYDSFFYGHMTAVGNKFVAEILAKYILTLHDYQNRRIIKRARRDSNLHQQLRRLLPYPLGYGRKVFSQ